VSSDMNARAYAGTYSDAMDGVMRVVAFPIKVSGRQACNFVKLRNRNERSRPI
jgi:hypothetical protein